MKNPAHSWIDTLECSQEVKNAVHAYAARKTAERALEIADREYYDAVAKVVKEELSTLKDITGGMR